MNTHDRDEQQQWPQLRIGSHRPLEYLPPPEPRTDRRPPRDRDRGYSDRTLDAVGWALQAITVVSVLALVLGLSVLAISWEVEGGLPAGVVNAAVSSAVLGGSALAALLLVQVLSWRWSREISARIHRGG